MHNIIHTKNNTIYLKYFFFTFPSSFFLNFFLLLSIQLFISLFYFFLLLFQGNRFPQTSKWILYIFYVENNTHDIVLNTGAFYQFIRGSLIGPFCHANFLYRISIQFCHPTCVHHMILIN